MNPHELDPLVKQTSEVVTFVMAVILIVMVSVIPFAIYFVFRTLKVIDKVADKFGGKD